jgi:hypothetical protein
MRTLSLTYPTPEGSAEIRVEGGRLSFGRGSEAGHRFPDDGLSRLHATIHRDGGRVWIVDENSSNGTFVNGERVGGSGTPLQNGDTVKIGHRTVLTVHLAANEAVSTQPVVSSSSNEFFPAAAADSSSQPGLRLLPIALIAFAILVMSVSAVLIGYKLMVGSGPQVVQADNDIDSPADDDQDADPTPTPKVKGTNSTTTTSGDNVSITNSPESGGINTTANVPAGKKYLQMTETEKRQYLSDRAVRVAQVIGNNSSEAIPAEALDKIKSFADAYAKRVNVKALGGCRFGDNLQSTFERASRNAPFIVRAFNAKGVDPRIGIYLAMIESEHCVCLQSPTGPLGMFQFTKATGELHGLKTVKGASPTNPDERCEPEPSARAAASYMKALTGRYGTGPSSVPLAIGSYNSGEGGLSSNLVKALESNSGLPRDFWTLIAKGDTLSKQFQAENFKYVPKFFAAAIIGENPQDFGLTLQPISTYSK